MNRTLERARRRPIVFLLVYGAFLLLIGITATAQAIMTSSHVRQSVLSSVTAADRAVVGTFIESYLRGTDLESGGGTLASRYDELEDRLREALARSDFLDSVLLTVEIVDDDRRVLFSSS
ncbi:MAG TPA: hypothetical protein VFP30_07875, partial [Candidatus Limnocylindria bacterium]|nr:hypothetical protein [Candidatus Limnocylindria bacterium]